MSAPDAFDRPPEPLESPAVYPYREVAIAAELLVRILRPDVANDAAGRPNRRRRAPGQPPVPAPAPRAARPAAPAYAPPPAHTPAPAPRAAVAAPAPATASVPPPPTAWAAPVPGATGSPWAPVDTPAIPDFGAGLIAPPQDAAAVAASPLAPSAASEEKRHSWSGVEAPAPPDFVEAETRPVDDAKRSRALKTSKPLETGLEFLPTETTREFFQKRIRSTRRAI